MAWVKTGWQRAFWCSLVCVAVGACGRTALVPPEARGPARADAGPDAPDASRGVERCNGLDDDGDGEVDEGLPPRRCGTGACAREVPGCEGGRVPECVPGRPRAELCDGRDDDCDGQVDEDLPVRPVAPPFAVRVAEGSTGSCPECRSASDPRLLATEDGFLAIWRLDFDPRRPEPNVFARALTADGRPTGDVFELFDAVTTRGFRVAARDADAAALVFCGRAGPNDVPASALFAPTGALLGTPEERSPADGYGCGSSDPDVAWVGDRALLAWTDTGAREFRVLLEVADAALVQLSVTTLEDDASTPGEEPRIGVSGDRALVASGVRRLGQAGLLLYVVDRDGAFLAEPTFVPPPGPGERASRWGVPIVVGDDEGFLVLGAEPTRPDRRGRFALRVSRDGSVVAGPWRFDAGDSFFELDAERRPGGGAYLVGNVARAGESSFTRFLSVLDDEGREQTRWESNEVPGGFLDPDLVVVDERVFVVWREFASDPPNRVLVREFGCTPG